MLRKILSIFSKDLVPMSPATIYRLEGVPPSISQDMSADRIHGILRSAEAGMWDDYQALIRDIVSGDVNLLADLGQRKTRLLSKPWKAASEDAKDPRAARNDAFCIAQLKGVDGFIPALSHLLDSSLWPVSVVEKIYAPGTAPGVRYRLAKLVPVPHHLLDSRKGILSIKETGPDGLPTGQLLPCDPMRYIIHRGHLLQSLPDCWGGPARALLFWWFIAASARGWWTQGVERNGVPFLVGKYDSVNPADRGAMLSAFRAAARTFGLAISRETEVEVHKDMASGDAGVHQRLLEFCQAQMSRLVVGQTMTGKAEAQGLGGSQANVQDDVLTDIVQFDAVLLGATLDEQLLKPLMHLNSLDGPVPALSWQITTEDALGAAKVLQTLKTAGISLKEEGLLTLSEAVGLPVVLDAPAVPIQPPDASGPNAPPVPPSPGLPKPPAQLRADVVPAYNPGAQDALDDIARAGAADLAQAFRGTLAPVRQLIRESTSAPDLEARLAKFYADLPPGRLAALTQDALAASAGNAAAGFRN